MVSHSMYATVLQVFQENLDGLCIIGPEHRRKIVDGIRSQVKIRPGEEERWVREQLPEVERFVSFLKFNLLGTEIKITVTEPRYESVLVSYTRGTSWFSAVDLIGIVAQALQA